jgi:carboxypeptidase T
MLTTILLFDVIAITLLPLLVYYAFKRFDNSKSLFLLKDIQQNLNFRGAYKTLTLLLLLSSTVLVKGYEKYTNVKIYVPAEKSQLLDLIGLLEIDHYHEHDGAFNYTVDQEELSILKKSGYQYEIIHEDAVKYLEEENAKYYESVKNGKSTERVAYERTGDLVDSIIKTPSAFVVQSTLGGYYSFAQMQTAISTLKATYPTLVDTFTIGLSTEGRPIKCLKISDNPSSDESEPEILFMGHHHAREAIGGASMIFLMQYLCQNYATDSRIKDLVDNREIFIIVCANPDGWEHNRTLSASGGGQWRKNRRVNGSGQFGVDLNRNWGVNFANCTGAVGAASCGSSTTSSDVYWGPSQYSEPETRALRLLCRQRDFVAVMDQHSVGPYYSLPWGRLPPVGVAMSAIDDDVYTQMASVMGKYNGMRYGSTYQTLGYEVSGGMKDVLLKGDDSLPNGKSYGMTGEGSNGSSGTSFWPIAADIVRLCKGMVYQDLQLIYTIGSYVDLQDKGSINLSAKTGHFKFNARRIGLGNAPVTVSVIPLQNIASVGSPVTIATASLPNFNSVYNDSISFVLNPLIAAGNSIKFAWRIQTGGYTYYDTVTNIFQGNVLFTDNMEGALASTNWTINSGWAYTNDGAYTGTKSLAESPASNYADNVNLIAQKATNLNLSGAGAAYLSFWVKYRSENFRDFLRVEVSTNGTTWVSLIGQNTVRQPGTTDGNRLRDSSALTGINEFWSREIFDLKNFLGASALRLRFRFNSGANSIYVYDNDAGFNIDDVTVITGGTPALLPLELTAFTGYNDGAVNILNWKTATEFNTKHFIVQKSVNAVDYEDIGIVAAAGNSYTTKNYTFTDKSPYKGENLYRLKMVDLDESYKYSKLVSIILQDETAGITPTGIEKIYPNPTNGKTFVNINVNEEQISIQLQSI